MYSWKICMSLEIGQMLLSKIQQNKRFVSLKKKPEVEGKEITLKQERKCFSCVT